MITHVRGAFTYADFEVVLQSQSDLVFNSYSDITALADRGLHSDVKYYRSAVVIVAVRVPVPRGVSLPLLFLRQDYVESVVQSCNNLSGPGRPTLQNVLHRFDTAIRWEYALALVQSVVTEGRAKWPGYGMARVFPQFHSQSPSTTTPGLSCSGILLFHRLITSPEHEMATPADRRVQKTPHLVDSTIEWIFLSELPVPDEMSDVGDTQPKIPKSDVPSAVPIVEVPTVVPH